MNRRKTQRFIIGVVLLGLVILGYSYLRQLGSDPDPGSKNTAGWIAALRQTDDGTQAVMIQPDGKMTPLPGYRPSARDRSLSWRADGQRLFFISDRDPGSHIYRYNPALEVVERRTADKGSKTALDTQEWAESTSPTILVTAGGRLMDFNPRTGKSVQLIPPGGDQPTEDTSEPGGGSVSAFEAMYQRLGTAFKMAKWGPDRKFIVFTMIRDGGELLAVQDMTPQETTAGMQLGPPQVVETADRIVFDIAKDGTVVYSLQGFQWPDPTNIPPEFMKGAVATKPYEHLIGFFQINNSRESRRPILIIPKGDQAPGDLAISPDGLKIAVIAGTRKPDGAYKSDALVVMPIKEGGAGESIGLVRGDVMTPSWTADGSAVLYAKMANGSTSLEKIQAEAGAQPSPVGPPNANLISPMMSPAKP